MPPPSTDAAAYVIPRLVEDGFLEERGGRLRTTRKWQLSMARAALLLANSGDDDVDLRVPIAMALVDRYGDRLSESELVDCVEAMLPIEAIELDPSLLAQETPPRG